MKLSALFLLILIAGGGAYFLVFNNGFSLLKTLKVKNFWADNFNNQLKLAAEINLDFDKESDLRTASPSLLVSDLIEKNFKKNQDRLTLTRQLKEKEKRIQTKNFTQHSSSTSLATSTIDSAAFEFASSSKLESLNLKTDSFCDFENPQTSSYKVIFNEIAWMGSLPKDGEASGKAASREWLELKNISQNSVDLNGWQILNSMNEIKIKLRGKIGGGSFYLLERGSDDSVPDLLADEIYSGALSNSGEWLRLFDNNCGLVDEIDASSGWPGGDNLTKKTLERNGQLKWQTSFIVGGTPKTENSTFFVKSPEFSSSSTSISPVFDKFTLTVRKEGRGDGLVIDESTKAINCGEKCSAVYPSGTTIILKAIPSNGSLLNDWFGWEKCDRVKASCEIVLNNDLEIVANFNLLPAPAEISSKEKNQNQSKLIIVEIQITGGPGRANDDFVKIYNPNNAPVNLKGYRLVKRTKTGVKDYLIKSWVDDTILPPFGYYTWANSDFTSLSPPPKVTTSATLAADNGVAIRYGSNDTGFIVDAVGWGEAQNEFVEKLAFPSNPVAGQILRRKFINDQFQDTDNNFEDFELLTFGE